MRNLKLIKILTLFTTVCILTSTAILAVPFNASANTSASPSAVGSCGANAHWEYYEDSKTLKILGSGAMYEYQREQAPWFSYMDETEKIIVGNDITKISKGAFFGGIDCDQPLTELSIPFIGESKSASGPQAVLGYIFGYDTIYFYSMGPDSPKHFANVAYTCSSSQLTATQTFYEGDSSMTVMLMFLADYDSHSITYSTSYNECKDTIGKCYSDSIDLSFYNYQVCSKYCTSYQGQTLPTPFYTTWQYTAFTGPLINYYTDDTSYSLESYYYYIPRGLTTVNITNSNTIPTAAFNSCSYLTSINTNLVIESVGEYAFQGCGVTPLYALEVQTYTNGVDTIKYVVQNGNAIIIECQTTNESISIPKAIDSYPITAIEQNAFSDMDNVKSMTIPTTITSIADNAFEGCTSLTDVYYDGKKDDWDEISIGTGNSYLLNATIHFSGISVTGITLNISSLEMCISDVETLQATITPTDASNQNINWSSSLTSVATVSDGIVTAVGAGTATITATTEDGGFTATCTVTVEAPEADPNAPTITASTVRNYAGRTVDVTIDIANNPGVAFVRLKVGYDTDALTLINVSDTNLISGATHSNNLSANPYTLYWNNPIATENITANGTAVTLTFEIAEDAGIGTYPITVSYDYGNSDIVDKDFNKLVFAMVNGAVNVTDVISGDADGDGVVTPVDNAYVARYVADWTGYDDKTVDTVAADVNCDGRVNSVDVAILARHIAEWIGYETLPMSVGN